VESFQVLATGANGALVLARDGAWVAALEKDPALTHQLLAGAPFTAAGRQIFVVGSTPYTGGRVLYQCVALAVSA
jgi:hypothetical protein